jgi:NitT/TauT family transport system substrate-binding protein
MSATGRWSMLGRWGLKRLLPPLILAWLVLTSAMAVWATLLAAEKVVFAADWPPGGDKALPFYVMHKGLFAAEGLDVTIRSARGSSEAIENIAIGEADMGSGGLTALLQARAENNVPVSAVLSVFPMQPDALFTIEGSDVKSLRDIEGKKVATATFSSSNAIWPLILKSCSVDESRVTLLKMDNPEKLVSMLSSGQVDAVVSWTTSSTLFVKELTKSGRKLNIVLWTECGLEGYGYSLFASNKLIVERPDLIRKFVRAFLLGIRIALTNPDDVAKSMKALFPELNTETLVQQFNTVIPLISNAITRSEKLGTFDRARVRKTWEWTAKTHGLPFGRLDPETVVDRSFLPN